jgi:hypothetical protein
MLQPYHSKSPHPGLSHPFSEMLPTGNNFGGSNLNPLPLKISTPTGVISIFVSIVQKCSEFLIQLFSLILVTIWFWCLLAAVGIAFGWDRKIDNLKSRQPERVPFPGTLTGECL